MIPRLRCRVLGVSWRVKATKLSRFPPSPSPRALRLEGGLGEGISNQFSLALILINCKYYRYNHTLISETSLSISTGLAR